MNLPPSVQFYRPNVTWEPKAACRMSFSDWDECDAKFGTLASSDDDSGPTARPSRRPSSSSSGYNIYDDFDPKVVWIIAAVCIAIPALTSIIALIVCCVRQKNRKKFYGPLAAYYRSGGAPPPTAFNQSGLLAGHYKAQSAALQGHHKYASVSSDLPHYETQQHGGQAYDPPKPFAGQAYDPPHQTFPGQPYQQYQYEYPYKA